MPSTVITTSVELCVMALPTRLEIACMARTGSHCPSRSPSDCSRSWRSGWADSSSSTIVWQASSLAAVWVVMQKVPNLNGWNYDEVLLIVGELLQ